MALKKGNCDQDNLQECNSVTVKGTDYEKGNVLISSQTAYETDTVLGKICIFLHDENKKIYVLLETIESTFCPELRAYEIGIIKGYECLPLNQLISYEPMHIYNTGKKLFVKPKYGFVANHL